MKLEFVPNFARLAEGSPKSGIETFRLDPFASAAQPRQSSAGKLVLGKLNFDWGIDARLEF
jgi:hypothetical protein